MKIKIVLSYSSFCYKILFAAVFISIVSCQKLVEVSSPVNQLVTETVFSSNAVATAAQLSIYAQMEAGGITRTLPNYTGLTSDEYTGYERISLEYIGPYNSDINVGSTLIRSIWNTFYNYIYQANGVIEGLEKSTVISADVKKQLVGEACFTRALSNFYLVNLFGDIPLVLTTDYAKNRLLSRASKDSVYVQIIEDLKTAKSNLREDYVSATNSITTERVRPNRWAAAALLARVYLYRAEWANAETEATSVISQTAKYSIVSNLNGVFLKNSLEAIWQLMSTIPGINTYNGALNVPNGAPSASAGGFDISPQALLFFESGDKRRTAWVKTVVAAGNTYNYPFKYQVGANAPAITEYTMVLRLSEQYLIRAEARAQLNNISGSQADLNVIRNRAGLANSTASTTNTLIDAISKERGAELLGEFSDRWLNLKRTGKVDQVMSTLRGSKWQATDKLYPIPLQEINSAPNLTQNPGY